MAILSKHDHNSVWSMKIVGTRSQHYYSLRDNLDPKKGNFENLINWLLYETFESLEMSKFMHMTWVVLYIMIRLVEKSCNSF